MSKDSTVFLFPAEKSPFQFPVGWFKLFGLMIHLYLKKINFFAKKKELLYPSKFDVI